MSVFTFPTIFKKKATSSDLSGKDQEEKEMSPFLKKVLPIEDYYQIITEVFPTALNIFKRTSWTHKDCNGFKAMAQLMDFTGQYLTKQYGGLWGIPYEILVDISQQQEQVPYQLYEESTYSSIYSMRKFKYDFEPIYSKWPFGYAYWLYKKWEMVDNDFIVFVVENFGVERRKLLSPKEKKRQKVYYIETPSTVTIGVVEDSSLGQYFIALKTVCKSIVSLVPEDVLDEHKIMSFYLGLYDEYVRQLFENKK